jgi:phosphoglycolate phosphatase
MSRRVLVLWDIDRTLLYVGDVDQQIYRDIFEELAGRPATVLPERGTGVTTPVVLQHFFASNGVPSEDIARYSDNALALLPQRLAERRGDLTKDGMIMPGAVKALEAVRACNGTVQSVVSGNLRSSAIIKLAAFELERYLEVDIGGFACDDDYRPNLVAIAQSRAARRYESAFTRTNTVIIGDSCEDVRTARLGGSSVIGITSGTTTRQQLADAGADIILDDLTDSDSLLSAIGALAAG